MCWGGRGASSSLAARGFITSFCFKYVILDHVRFLMEDVRVRFFRVRARRKISYWGVWMGRVKEGVRRCWLRT